VTDVFKIELTDLVFPASPKRGYLILRHNKNKKMIITEGENFIADKVKVVINKKGEVVVISTSVTVFRAEQDDTFTVGSFELSQKEEDL